MSHALAGRIPRAFKNHQSPEGYLYGEYLRALLARLGPLPASAKPILKEVGRLAVDLHRLRVEQDEALGRRRLAVARRIDRRLTPVRSQLVALEERLELLASNRKKAATSTGADLVERIRADQAAERNGHSGDVGAGH